MTTRTQTLQQAKVSEPPTSKLNNHTVPSTPATNGHVLNEIARGWRPDLNDDDHAVLALRNLIFDICNQNGGGHGGSAIGMSAIGVALYKHVMRYNPTDPSWFDRDRFVLSNGMAPTEAWPSLLTFPGHCAMFLYALNHLVGFDNFTTDQLRGYGSAKINGYETICHGHPEIEVPGVEVTTGPLGQGIANAVGLAIASKSLAAQYNEPDFEVVKSQIYCMTGDGCLMEGVALEAISLAGHLQLDNLTLIYDNNAVTCDGPLDWINTEDVNQKMMACGWNVIEVFDGSYDVQVLVDTFKRAQQSRGKPTFINIKTIIGLGTQTAGTAKAHHGAFDAESVAASKRAAGQDPSSSHTTSDRALAYLRERRAAGQRIQSEWDGLLQRYASQYPQKAADFAQRRQGQLGSRPLDILDKIDTTVFRGKATREINGALLEKLWPECKALHGGGADLVNSNKFYYSEHDVFHPATGYTGRYMRYGIREHAMASISNGLAAYNPGTFLPVTATFFMFYIYVSQTNNLLILHANSCKGCPRCANGRIESSTSHPFCNP